jgi:hypothetical protein
MHNTTLFFITASLYRSCAVTVYRFSLRSLNGAVLNIAGNAAICKQFFAFSQKQKARSGGLSQQ